MELWELQNCGRGRGVGGAGVGGGSGAGGCGRGADQAPWETGHMDGLDASFGFIKQWEPC